MIRKSKDIGQRETPSRRCFRRGALCVSIVYRSFQISSRSRWDAGEFMSWHLGEVFARLLPSRVHTRLAKKDRSNVTRSCRKKRRYRGEKRGLPIRSWRNRNGIEKHNFTREFARGCSTFVMNYVYSVTWILPSFPFFPLCPSIVTESSTCWGHVEIDCFIIFLPIFLTHLIKRLLSYSEYLYLIVRNLRESGTILRERGYYKVDHGNKQL